MEYIILHNALKQSAFTESSKSATGFSHDELRAEMTTLKGHPDISFPKNSKGISYLNRHSLWLVLSLYKSQDITSQESSWLRNYQISCVFNYRVLLWWSIYQYISVYENNAGLWYSGGTLFPPFWCLADIHSMIKHNLTKIVIVTCIESRTDWWRINYWCRINLPVCLIKSLY